MTRHINISNNRVCTYLDSRKLAVGISTLRDQEALALPCLGDEERKMLVTLVDALPYRAARAVTGIASAPVYQDFELCYNIPSNHQLWSFAHKAGIRLASAVKKSGLVSSELELVFNDLIVQRYPPGCQGITPHRDHVRYHIMVAIFILTGNGSFYICQDRGGNSSCNIPAAPGDLLLMRAPGFAAKKSRPLHFVNGVTRTRRTIGLRYDTYSR
jgi:hypothetical protein